jgi:uncharacterized protein YjcR
VTDAYSQPPMTMKAIAQLLGVTSNQVYMWHQRRHTSGFPAMVAQTIKPHHPGDKKKSPLFDVDEVVDWYSKWDPNRNRGAHYAEKRRKAGDHRPYKRGMNRKKHKHGS